MATAHPIDDPVQAALRAPVVKRMTAEHRAGLEEDLRLLAESAASDEELRELIAIRIGEEEYCEAHPLTTEEIAELEAAADEAEEDLRAGRCIPVAEVFASLGIPWPPAPAG